MFDLFPKKKSVDEILETNEALCQSIKKEASDLASGVVNSVHEIIALKKDLEDQKQLKDSLQRVNEKYIKKINEQADKIILLENAIERWHSRSKAWEKLDEELKSSVSELTKEVIGLRHLKKENVELIEKLLEKEGKRYGITFNEAKTQIIQNDYKKCAEERDEYKHQLNAANKEIEALKLMYEERETKLKTYNRSLQCQITSLKEEKEKHSMYPLHWGGYDGAASAYPKQYSDWLNEQKEKYDKNIIDFVESEFSNEDPLEGKQVEFNSEELLKRATEYADSLDSLPKSFPDEFQEKEVIDWMADEGVPNDWEDGETTAENLEERFDAGKNVLDYFSEWKCPYNKCKKAKTEKSWEEATSDLALKVAKLEKKIEELSLAQIGLKKIILDSSL